MSARPILIRMHADDNVAIVGNADGLAAGTRLPDDLADDLAVGAGLTLRERVPQAHKLSLTDLPAGTPVIRYGVVIGRTKVAIPAGSWVHEQRLDIPPARELHGLPMATDARPVEPDPALSALEFMGYRNADGSVGTRNLLAITTTVQCVAGVAEQAARRIREQLLPLYPNVDGVVALTHSYGCGVAIDAPDAVIPIRTLRHISLNPNFGGEVMVVSLGCEKLQPARLMPPGSIPIAAGQPPAPADGPDTVCLQDGHHVGFMSMLESIAAQARPHLERLNARQRVPVPVSELVVGVQCGGSDAFSGVTANPVVGHATDLLVRAGATVMFSENTEVRDAVEQLTRRAATTEVADAIVRELDWYDRYLERGRADRTANTTPGNKAGGLSNIAEKAMGSIVKSGSSAIAHVLAPGEKLRRDQRGLVFAATPASDFICGTLQLAAGMNLHIFTTGRGTPYGLAECPVIKVGTRTELAQRWHDLIDLNAGVVADGPATIESLGRALFEQMLAVASGQRTWAERWRLHNDLVLFNPAPIT